MQQVQEGRLFLIVEVYAWLLVGKGKGKRVTCQQQFLIIT